MKEANPMKEMVEIFVPLVSGEENSIFVGINGKGWTVPRGKKVQVPKPVAELIERSQKNANTQMLYKQQLEDIYNKSQGARN